MEPTLNKLALADVHNPNISQARYDPVEEERLILKYWEEIDAFHTQLKKSEGRPRYSFYDGPPFATGLPHYGHLLAGTIKDIVTRYATCTGHYVERRFGWDCHGLPVEYEIDKTLNITSRDDVLKMGIDKYNAQCRSIVMRYSSEWEATVTRMGRWIDFKNDYKTLNTPFMESVWWVFSVLFKKEQVYRGYKVMPYSTGCSTPLSNFEANQNYKDVVDPAVTVALPIEGQEGVSLLAWTTTPWTLPSNLALCVNPSFEYVQIKDEETGQEWILLEKRLEVLYKDPKKAKFTVVKKMKGTDLVGLRYKPLFDYYADRKDRSFRVVADSYVTDDSGTGIVHQAPGFGEDDYRVCVANGIVDKDEQVPCPVDSSGRFTSIVADFIGVYVKEADKLIIKHLKANGRMIRHTQLTHSYPFCWRSDTPLIYKAVPSWFVRVENIVDKLLKNNQQTRWVPSFVQDNRFGKWLENARDWAISRNRFWGTPIPLWVSDDFEEIVCVSSIKELEELSGVKVNDLHRDFIDHITIPSKKGGVLRRIDEVFDCWFESGSMPYAQQHYPFENVQKFDESFPADFIAEGLDQTRGWFYTLLVLSTHLFDKPPFKNLIVNGLVLAEDGKKMSKRLKNYPEPTLILDTYGADSLRLYLINSPVVRAETLKFKQEGVKDVLKDVLTPWINSFKFLVAQAYLLNKEEGVEFKYSLKNITISPNTMDKWILASTQSLVKFVREEMNQYRLYTVVPRLLKLIEDLTNWYIRFNRRRLKGESGKEETVYALNTLFEVLYTLVRLMAPFTPFISENMYQGLRKFIEEKTEDSIHFLDFPVVREEYFDLKIERVVGRLQAVILLGRQLREKHNVSLRFPLKKMVVVHSEKEYLDDLLSVESYILEELNLRELTLTQNEDEFNIKYKAVPDNKSIGLKFLKQASKVRKIVQELTSAEVKQILLKPLEKDGFTLTSEEVKIQRYVTDSDLTPGYEHDLVILLDMKQDNQLRMEGLAREWSNRVQKMRKKAGLNQNDIVDVYYTLKTDLENQLQMMLEESTFLETLLKRKPLDMRQLSGDVLIKQQDEIQGSEIELVLVHRKQ